MVIGGKELRLYVTRLQSMIFMINYLLLIVNQSRNNFAFNRVLLSSSSLFYVNPAM